MDTFDRTLSTDTSVRDTLRWLAVHIPHLSEALTHVWQRAREVLNVKENMPLLLCIDK